MEEEEIDTVYITSPENIFYFSGHRRVMPGGRWPLGIAVNVEGENFVAFCEKDEEAFLRRASVPSEAYFYGTAWGGGVDPYDVIINTLKEKGWLKGRVGVEKWTWYPSHISFEQLISGFEGAGAKVVDASKPINDNRYIKSPQELDYVRKAGKIADIGMTAAQETLEPGVTELDVVAEIEAAMCHAGGERPAGMTMVQSGPRSMFQHGVPTQRVIMDGDIVSVDFCGVYQRYHADLGRTFCIGEPPKKVADLMEKAAGCFEVLRKSVNPGDPLKMVQSVSEEYYKTRGVDPWYAGGYTLGIGFEPSWAGEYFYLSDKRFDPGVVTNFDHCFVFEEDSLGTCVIDTFIMTEDGIELLSKIQRDIIIL